MWNSLYFLAERVCEKGVQSKIAAHAAELAPASSESHDENELSRARLSFDWKRHFEWVLDPETASAYAMKCFLTK